MKKLKYLVILLLSFVLITGCGTNNDEDTSKKSDKKTEIKEENKDKKNKDKENKDKTDKKKPIESQYSNLGNADLVCTTTQVDEQMTMLGTVYFYYNEEKLSNINLNFDVTLKDEQMKSMWSLFTEMLDEQFNEMYPINGQEGLELISSSDDSNFIYNLKINIDLTKANISNLSEYGLNFGDISEEQLAIPVNDLRISLNKNGFVCQ